MNWTALVVFVLFFLLVTILGFIAVRWRRGDLGQLEEWGLAGRRFGTVITWFLLGGDLYTAYTFIAVPALMYGKGALGFYAVPYTIIVYPFVFMVMPRLWSVARKHGYITASDFVKGRFDSKGLALVMALTGIVATMPYIALQLSGMQAVFNAMGLTGDWPLVIAFVLLALYTYTSGLRAPAAIAVVKDLMIYTTVIAAIIIIPHKLHGFSHIFSAANTALMHHNPPGALVAGPKLFGAYATLALGSALALFLYPHSLTGVLSSRSRDVIKRNMALLPAYSFALGIIALLGLMALAAGVSTKNPNAAVPLLFLRVFPDWFSGFAFAAIAIGALVPASIMSIAAANLFTRNIYREFFNKSCTPQHESSIAKFVSLIVKFGALAFIIWVPNQFTITFQQMGGIWILQTLPAVVIGLYTRWLNRWALLIGWATGLAWGTYMIISTHFTSTVYALNFFGHTYTSYAALWALVLNLIVSVVLSAIFNAMKVGQGRDATKNADYHFEVASM